MGFWSRFAAFFGFGRAAPASLPSSPALSGSTRGAIIGRRQQAGLLEAYSDYPHLHTVVRGRAEAVGQVEWVLFRQAKGASRAARLRGADHHRAIDDEVAAGTLVAVDKHPVLTLARRPSAMLSGPAFWELASTHEDLVGEVIWLKAARAGKSGPPTALHPVPPSWLESYDWKKGLYKFNSPSQGRWTAPAADVIWHKLVDPADPYGGRGVGTAMVLKDELLTDELMAGMARGRFKNRGYPDLLLGLLGHTTAPGPRPGEAEVARMLLAMEQKHGGVERAGQAHIIAGDFKAQLLGHSLVDNQYIDGRRFGRDTVMQSFRRPPELAGVLENANRSTIGVAEDLEARQSTTPKLDRFRSLFQDHVLPDFAGDLVISYRSVIPADRDYEATFIKALPGAFTINDIRRRAGLPPLEGPEGEQLYKAPGSVPVAGSPSSPSGADKEKQP